MIIVIAAIGVLAAIILVAYNGFQQDAKQAALLSDLDSATSMLELGLKTDGHYPATVLLADGGNGLPTGSGTTYQYTVDASTTTPSYCLTGTNGTSTYKISSASGLPTTGGCPGHGVGGVPAVTNLVTNPSFETNITGWAAYVGVSAPTQVMTTPWSGSARLSAVGNNTVTTPRVFYILPVSTGDSVFASARVRSDGQTPTSSFFVIKTRLNGAETGTVVATSTSWAPDGSGWMLASGNYTVPVNVDALMILPGVVTASNYTGTLGVDAVIATKGSSLANYADGSSSNWIWNGTPNASTSTGPAL
jgi:type II secretory pathway pseudopilin PulG